MTLRRAPIFGLAVTALVTAMAASLSWMPEAWCYFALYNDLGPLISQTDTLANCSQEWVREEVRPARKIDPAESEGCRSLVVANGSRKVEQDLPSGPQAYRAEPYHPSLIGQCKESAFGHF